MSFIRGAGDDSKFPTLGVIQATMGFIPNFYRAQTLRPDLIDAEVGLVGTLLLREGALSRQQKEYIFIACSADNLSTYCVTAHCEIVRMLGIQGPEPEQIALDHSVADIPLCDKALLDFAVRLNALPREITRQDVDALREHGFEDAHILEAVLIVGLARFANTVSFGLGTVPDFDASRIEVQLGYQPNPAQIKKVMNPSSDNSVLMSEGGDASASPVVDEDGDLVRRSRAGELDAFDELIRRHQQRIYRTLITITRSPEDAEDALQNVFLKAYQYLGGFQGASKFVTWLTRIAINEGTERLRSRKDFDSLDEQNIENEPPFQPRNVAAWQVNPEEAYSQTELRELVERALMRLPVKYRVVIMLRDMQQLTAEETAEVLKIGVPALKSRLLRGRLMLRECLAPTLGRRTAHV